MKAEFTKLYEAAFGYPAIDNHAHPLLRAEYRENLAFEGLISEAKGDALKDACHTLACYRVTPQLTELLGLPPGSSWEDVKAKRSELEYLDLCRRCFAPSGIQCILIDDGLGVRDIVYDVAWHSQFTDDHARRVVRIEVIAEDILEDIFRASNNTPPSSDDLENIFSHFMTRVRETLTTLGQDTQVAAYKSVVCYRSGLAISSRKDSESRSDLLSAFGDLFETYRAKGKIRLATKAVNDALVKIALEVAGKCGKPVQFHTGLGDNDISLLLSSPAHLQPIIEAYPETMFILLHSSYPYTREAGYLTAVYPNVYLDFGEVFPFVSGQGQRSIVKQVLELAPTTKIMWSTDGHFWPESYYLGTIQARQALFEVLNEIVKSEELTETEAVGIVENALFHNANRVYGLGLKPRPPMMH